MPSFRGPYLAAAEKPQLDPAVLHLVDIAKGNVVPAAPGWGGGPLTPVSAGGAANNTDALQPLSLPKHAEVDAATPGAGCLSPAAHEAGKLTYGIYEGGGVAAAAATKPRATPAPAAAARSGGGEQAAAAAADADADARRRGGAESVAAQAAAAAVLEEQLQAEEQDGRAAGGTGMTVAAVEYAESALPVLNTPRVAPPTPMRRERGSSREATSSNRWMTASVLTPREDGTQQQGLDPGSLEEQAKRRREATAQIDNEMEVALWIEGVTGETFPGKFWSSLKDGGEEGVGFYNVGGGRLATYWSIFLERIS